MASWQSKAFNQLLFRVMRNRLERCDNVFDMRKVIDGMDRLGSFINHPSDMFTIPFKAGSLKCEWIEMPDCRRDGVILFFHGGGFCFKSPLVHNAVLARLSEQTGLRGMMVDYPLAPEHPFPCAQEACLAGYRWLLAHGVPAASIIMAGDSAGGNLVLSCLMKLKQDRQPLPAAAVLFSPSVDLAMTGESSFAKRNVDPFFALPTLLLMRNSYLNTHCPCDPLVSPLYGDLSGLPPMMIHVGSEEVLLDDSVRLAEKVKAAGGEVNLSIWEGMPHVFPIFHQLPEAQQAIQQCGQFVVDKIERLAEPLPQAEANVG
ncbi:MULTISPECIES: alpha/beta hydrolase [Corallincola]|uniref:Alpha/beta hydrolase n=3 Tax=Corallincola TaxID=1775176 RepID=A0A368NR38_9GAMM|nr:MULTISPECIES: alpha/beta hydrolase [Corallincola]RCU52868.1 alpha/beta hydrolase [Corallincola holothuriorum]TAA47980.1 alpha/beta hydrolase [Corallincola spongiicola]TCI03366.1 alpha/beta hydrolase [Corallincola luteus]